MAIQSVISPWLSVYARGLDELFCHHLKRHCVTYNMETKVHYILSTCMVLGAGLIFLFGGDQRPSPLECTMSMHSWSPAWDAVDQRWETFQNDFSQKSAFRGQPTAAIEAAWNSILQESPIPMSSNEMELPRGIEPSSLVTDKDGNFLGHLEVFRNLACLNLLRQHTFRDDYSYDSLSAFQGTEGEIMSRMDGCVQRLRNVLMCEGDTTPYLIMLTPDKKQKESPDFNTLHYCKDFTRILDWAKVNGVQESQSSPPLYSLTGA